MKPDPEQMRRFQELWTAFLEGDLSEESNQELQGLIDSREEFLSWAVEQYEIHRLLGFSIKNSTETSNEFVRRTLAQVLTQNETFTSETMERVRESKPTCRNSPSSNRQDRVSNNWSGWAIAGGIAGVVGLVVCSIFMTMDRTELAELDHPPAIPGSSEVDHAPVRFSKVARALFFGELSPAANSTAQLNKTYVLKSGMVELQFPHGALAVLEAPAVFRICGIDRLELDVGQCSVHAPEGAQGFQVDTPDTNIVDRGTRFVVNVSEFSETEVQVVEGVADLYQKGSGSGVVPQENRLSPESRDVRLQGKQALRVQSDGTFKSEPAPFRTELYRRQLPDRVISYTATSGPDGRADELLSVTVQRNGQEQTFSVQELIPVEIVAFRAQEVSKDGHFLGQPVLPLHREELSSDRSLATGIINPGGSVEPLTSSPILIDDPSSDQKATPGIGFRFRTPLKNQPGPDLVLFETHPISSTTDGDPFHICPLEMRPGQKALTVKTFDLSLVSPESLPVTHMYAHILPDRKADSLKTLLEFQSVERPVRYDYRALAVAIDLSDLGCLPGESVSGVFIQDAEDGAGRVDPVFIGGLP